MLLIGVTISSVLQWVYGCLHVYWRSEVPGNKGNQSAILSGEVIDWSTLAYVVPTSTEAEKLTTLWFSAGAYAYMAIALFIYLAVLAYYVFACWFRASVLASSDTAVHRIELIIRGNQPFNYFSELFNYIFAATVLGLSAGYCMRLQAQYLNSAEATIFAYAFTDLQCVVGVVKGNGLSDCRPTTWDEVGPAIGGRGTASSFTGFGEAVYTLALFAVSISLLWRAFDLTKAHYLERIGDPQWQRTVGIKYDTSFVEKIDNGTFLSIIAPNYVHLSAVVVLLVIVIVVPYLGTIYLLTIIYAFISLIRNRQRAVDLRPTENSIYTVSFKGTTLAEPDREEIVLLLSFHHSGYDFGSFLDYVVDEADIPRMYRDHLRFKSRGTERPIPPRSSSRLP